MRRLSQRVCLSMRRFCSCHEIGARISDDLLHLPSRDNESFLSSPDLFQQVDMGSRTLIPVKQFLDFCVAASGGYYDQLDGYSSNEDDIAQFLLSNITVEAEYRRVGNGQQMTSVGSQALGTMRAHPSLYFTGNAGRVGHDTWCLSGTYASAGHVVAPIIDADGRECDENMIFIDCNNHRGAKSSKAALYKLNRIIGQPNGQIGDIELECVSLNPETDLACLKVKEPPQSYLLKSRHFMQLGEFDPNPQHLVLTGTRVAQSAKQSAKDTRSIEMNQVDLDFLFGPVGCQNMMAMKQGCVHEYCMPVQAKAWKSANPGLFNGDILHKHFNHPTGFDHYLSTLNGHSGSNISVEKGKICAIHIGSDYQGLRQCNRAAIIDSTISDHVKPLIN